MKKGKNGILRWLLRGILVLAILLVVVTIVVSLYLGPIIKRGAESLGPRFLGVPVEVEDVKVRPWKGTAEISGVMVGNPEGFKTPSAFELGSLQAEVDIGSLLSDTIVIRRLYITAPKVTYELKGRKSNINVLMANLQKDQTGEDAAEEEKQPAKKVILEHFVFEEGKLSFNSAFTIGKSLTAPLPRIELKDVGSDVGGLKAVDLVYQVFQSIVVSVGKGVVELSGELAGQGAEAAKALGAAGVGAAGDAAGLLTEGAGKVAGAGGDAAKAVGETGVNAAKDIGEAGTKAVKSVGSALGGWLGGGEAKKEEAEENLDP